jgi:hypothetical protein
MANTYTWASATNTGGYFGNASYVYSSGLSMPTGNLTLDSTLRPIKVYDVIAGYQSGGSGPYQKITYRGTTTAGPFLFTDSGATFTYLQGQTGAATQYFGRSSSGTTTDASDGSTWTGTLAGSITWGTVPTAPASIAVSRTGRYFTVTVGASSSNGGAVETGVPLSYMIQAKFNGGAWLNYLALTSAQAGVAQTFQVWSTGTWQFRAYAINGAGNSAASPLSSTFTVVSGGSRSDGAGGFTQNGYSYRYDGTTWVDITTAKRYDGSTWVDLTL